MTDDTRKVFFVTITTKVECCRNELEALYQVTQEQDPEEIPNEHAFTWVEKVSKAVFAEVKDEQGRVCLTLGSPVQS